MNEHGGHEKGEAPARTHAGKRQIDPGDYKLIQDFLETGRLIVIAVSPTEREEHWFLWVTIGTAPPNVHAPFKAPRNAGPDHIKFFKNSDNQDVTVACTAVNALRAQFGLTYTHHRSSVKDLGMVCP